MIGYYTLIMIEIIGYSIINWIILVLLGIGVGFLAQKLTDQKEDLVPILVASIVGAVAGAAITNLIFGLQITILNLSSFFFFLPGAFFLSILTLILHQSS